MVKLPHPHRFIMMDYFVHITIAEFRQFREAKHDFGIHTKPSNGGVN
jgi:hypothetical protein